MLLVFEIIKLHGKLNQNRKSEVKEISVTVLV